MSIPPSSSPTIPLTEFFTGSFSLIPLADRGEGNSFSITDGTRTKVRSKTYLHNKVKEHSQPNCLKLLGVDIVKSDKSLLNIASHPQSPIAKYHEQPTAPNVLVINFIIPTSVQLHLLICFELPESPNDDMDLVNYQELQTFLEPAQGTPEADKAYRNARFKMEPVVRTGPWLVRKVVGETPCLLGNKLRTEYYSGKRYFEIDVDVNSTSAGSKIFKMVRGSAKSLIVDLIFWLESKRVEDLPERILSGVRFYHPNMEVLEKNATMLDSSLGVSLDTSKSFKEVSYECSVPEHEIDENGNGEEEEDEKEKE